MTLKFIGLASVSSWWSTLMLGTSTNDGTQKHFLLAQHPTQSCTLPSWSSCLPERQRWSKCCRHPALGSEGGPLHHPSKSGLSWPDEGLLSLGCRRGYSPRTCERTMTWILMTSHEKPNESSLKRWSRLREPASLCMM